MLERTKWILKIACLLLAAVLLYQFVLIGIRLNPLARVNIPELPSLPADTNMQSGPNPAIPAMTPVRAGNGSNTSKPSVGTNIVTAALATGTNLTPPKALAQADTNSVSPPRLAQPETNPPPALESGAKPTNAPQMLASNGAATNVSSISAGTNAGVSHHPGTGGAGVPPGLMAMAMPGGFNPGRPMMSPPRAAPLPAAIQARVDRIVESEILGPFIRPQPAALIGIAGNFAFLRAPTGQTGLVKEGDDLGGLKLLRIGTNRVLVEEQGQKKELTIFSGFGGESLLPKQDTSHETNK